MEFCVVLAIFAIFAAQSFHIARKILVTFAIFAISSILFWVFFKCFLLKLRKQFASKFLPTRSILDISDAKSNLFVFVLASCTSLFQAFSWRLDGIRKCDGVREWKRMKFPYTQTRLTIKLSNSICKKKGTARIESLCHFQENSCSNSV